MNKLIIIIIFLLPCVLQAQEITGKIDAKKLAVEGSNLYKKGDYSKSAEKFKAAVDAGYDNTRGLYNLGNSYYRQNMYKEAVSTYESFAEQLNDPKQKSNAYHNLGNALLQGKEYEKSIDAYKKALKNNPTDADTRYNLAYAQKMLKKQQEQQKQNDKNENKDNKDNKNNKEENKDKKESEKEKKEREEKEKKEKEDKEKKENGDNGNENKNENGENKEKDKKEGEGQQRPNQLSKAQAKQLLDALNNNEKQLQLMMMKQKNKSNTTTTDKDW